MNISEFITTIRGWTGFKNPATHSDELITSWVRMGEERLNADLRVADMLQIDTATVSTSLVTTPADWLENDFLVDLTTGKELTYVTRSKFYAHEKPAGCYTVAGKFLIIGGEPDAVEGNPLELHYFGDVPALGDSPNWMSLRHPLLLTSATMTPASMYLQEPDRAIQWESGTTGLVGGLNAKYNESSPKGAKMVRKSRSLG